MEKLLILGASRGIGRGVLEQALADGMPVSVLVRPKSRFDIRHPLLTEYRGDLLNKDLVGVALRNVTSVAMCFGVMPTLRKVTLFSESTRLLLNLWSPEAERRLFCVTGIGAGESRGHGGWIYDKLVCPGILRQVYADKNRQEALLRASTLKWEIIRPGFLTNGPITAQYQVITTLDNFRAGKISRADVAHFIWSETVKQRFARKAVLLSA